MLYGDRGYYIAHARSRTKKALGRASRSESKDEHTKEKGTGVGEHLGANGAGRRFFLFYYRDGR
jgi:hypothetical protein